MPLHRPANANAPALPQLRTAAAMSRCAVVLLAPCTAASQRGVLVQVAWVNNYGVWCDEFEAMGLEDCFKVVWPKAVVHLNNQDDGIRCATHAHAHNDTHAHTCLHPSAPRYLTCTSLTPPPPLASSRQVPEPPLRPG